MSLFRPYQYKSRPDLVPGKGMVKNGFFQFFELYFRKFWRFISTNLCYFLITLPIVIYAFYLINGIFADRLEAMGEGYILFAGVGFIARFDLVTRGASERQQREESKECFRKILLCKHEKGSV